MFGIDWNLDGDGEIIDDMLTLGLLLNEDEESEDDSNNAKE